jgi:hypothetical protein
MWLLDLLMLDKPYMHELYMFKFGNSAFLLLQLGPACQYSKFEDENMHIFTNKI